MLLCLLPSELVVVICGRVSRIGAYSAISGTLINFSQNIFSFSLFVKDWLLFYFHILLVRMHMASTLKYLEFKLSFPLSLVPLLSGWIQPQNLYLTTENENINVLFENKGNI